MKVDHSTALFFDASCLIAAAGSPNGGSGFLLSLCARRLLRPVVSHVVLQEAEHNIQQKRGQLVLRAYHTLLISVPFTVTAVPIVPTVAPWLSVVNAKDAHVVVATLASASPYLLTLDRNLVTEIRLANLPFEVQTPGTFIKEVLIHHVDYESLR